MFKINNRIIDQFNPPYIIAELSANHNGSIETAKKTILKAQQLGADAVKLQTYTMDTMTIDCDKSDFIVRGGLWNGYKLYDLYREAHTPYEWHEELFSYARKIGITLFSTPFDETAVNLLESLNTPAYKIASFELTDLPLIELVAKTGKPLLMSTGMASEEEIREAVATARGSGCTSLLLFHCISSYPTPVGKSNLRQIKNIRDSFNVEVGLSDHTLGTTASVAAISLGASAIEKHFILSRNDKGPDSEFSLEPDDFELLIKSTKDAWLALGSFEFSRPEIENNSKCFRRSLYFVKSLKAGHLIEESDIRRIRPGFGLPPKYFNKILGKRILCDVQYGEPVKLTDIDISSE
jgi:pseudaminic acid synthase